MVASLSLSTGECALFDLGARDVKGLCAYKDGAALLSVQNGYTPEMYALDPASGATKRLCAFGGAGSVQGLAYDAANDRVYFTMCVSVCAMDGMNPDAAVAVAGFPAGGYQHLPPALTSDGRYLCRDDYNIFALGLAR